MKLASLVCRIGCHFLFCLSVDVMYLLNFAIIILKGSALIGCSQSKIIFHIQCEIGVVMSEMGGGIYDNRLFLFVLLHLRYAMEF